MPEAMTGLHLLALEEVLGDVGDGAEEHLLEDPRSSGVRNSRANSAKVGGWRRMNLSITCRRAFDEVVVVVVVVGILLGELGGSRPSQRSRGRSSSVSERPSGNGMKKRGLRLISSMPSQAPSSSRILRGSQREHVRAGRELVARDESPR